MSNPLEKKGLRLLVVLLMVSFAAVPLTIYGCAPEWARWDAAQANRFFRMGEAEEGIYQLRDAIRKSPRDLVIRLSLAKELIKLKRPEEALELANEVLVLHSTNKPALMIKTECQQMLGDFEGGLQTWLEYDQLLHAFNRNANSLNASAYHRALAGKELHLAHKDIDLANAWVNSQLDLLGEGEIRLHVKALVCATLVARCCDSRDSVRPELDRQIELIEDRRFSVEQTLLNEVQIATALDEESAIKRILNLGSLAERIEKEKTMLMYYRDQFLPGSESYAHWNRKAKLLKPHFDRADQVRLREINSTFGTPTSNEDRVEWTRSILTNFENELAVLLTCRALLHQDAEDFLRCDADRSRIVELDFDPAEIARSLPDEQSIFSEVRTYGASWLDTRGFIRSKLPWAESKTKLGLLSEKQLPFNSCYEDALSDLNVAVACMEVELNSLNGSLYNVVEFSGSREDAKEVITKTIAVIRNHRMSLFNRAGESAKANEDAQQIKQLGFNPGPSLF